MPWRSSLFCGEYCSSRLFHHGRFSALQGSCEAVRLCLSSSRRPMIGWHLAAPTTYVTGRSRHSAYKQPLPVHSLTLHTPHTHKHHISILQHTQSITTTMSLHCKRLPLLLPSTAPSKLSQLLGKASPMFEHAMPIGTVKSLHS
jgi:hypothetical protein